MVVQIVEVDLVHAGDDKMSGVAEQYHHHNLF